MELVMVGLVMWTDDASQFDWRALSATRGGAVRREWNYNTTGDDRWTWVSVLGDKWSGTSPLRYRLWSRSLVPNAVRASLDSAWLAAGISLMAGIRWCAAGPRM